MAMFSAGAILIAWSFGDGNQALWNLGAPLALAGQVAFLVGLVLQLDVIWQQGKSNTHRLEQLQQRITVPGTDVNQTVRPSIPDVREPAPDALLDDLKHRLDQLGSQLHLHRQLETRR
jgi:hypothetical protein